jgi:hypothetical protein
MPTVDHGTPHPPPRHRRIPHLHREVEAGVAAGDEALNTYADAAADPWRTTWLPRLTEISARTIVAESPKFANGRTISLAQVKELRAGHAVTHPRNREALQSLIRHLRERRPTIHPWVSGTALI